MGKVRLSLIPSGKIPSLIACLTLRRGRSVALGSAPVIREAFFPLRRASLSVLDEKSPSAQLRFPAIRCSQCFRGRRIHFD